ncbi:hypothetical protein BC826DRAFT_319512 [Russula brevipes]|nr:hypothetical protein BC826DRAFT_319512 [Russula brevipes]
MPPTTQPKPASSARPSSTSTTQPKKTSTSSSRRTSSTRKPAPKTSSTPSKSSSRTSRTTSKKPTSTKTTSKKTTSTKTTSKKSSTTSRKSLSTTSTGKLSPRNADPLVIAIMVTPPSAPDVASPDPTLSATDFVATSPDGAIDTTPLGGAAIVVPSDMPYFKKLDASDQYGDSGSSSGCIVMATGIGVGAGLLVFFFIRWLCSRNSNGRQRQAGDGAKSVGGAGGSGFFATTKA